MPESLKDTIRNMEKAGDLNPARGTFLNFIRHLEESSLHAEADEKNLMVKFGISGNGAGLRVIAYADEDRGHFAVMSVSSVNCMEGQRSLMAELLCRVNYRLAVGGFEFDMRDGEIRYKISQLIGSVPIEKEVLGHCLGLCIFTHERYGKLLVPLCLGLAPRPGDLPEDLKDLFEPESGMLQ
jgi:hypothetical protein